MSIDEKKQAVRDRVWRLLEKERAVPSEAYGKIPSFHGADQTAAKLADLGPWQNSRVVKANPDQAQFAMRVRALKDGKHLYMAVPKMASAQPFFVLDPGSIEAPFEEVAEKGGAAKVAPRVGVSEMAPIDLVLCGSVAVNRSGARVGKGAGYTDIEVALLAEAGLVTSRTIIVAPVHHLQVIEEEIPESEHDFRVDIIVTPTEVIECSSPKRPRGIIWDDLSPEMIAAIPALAARVNG